MAGQKRGKKRLSVFLYFFLSPPVVILPRKKIIRGEEEEERNGFLVHRCYTEIVRYIHGEKEEKPSVSHTTMGQQKSTTASFPLSIFILQSQSCAVARRRAFRKEEKVALNGPIGTKAIEDEPFWYLVGLA